jgi:benzodiazapine receptor
VRRVTLSSIALAVLWTVAVAVAGSLMMNDGAWYRGLAKPEWNPPDWLSQVAWSLVLALSSVAAVVAANSSLSDRRFRFQLAGAFVGNGFLNVLWNYFLFRCQRPDWALMLLPMFWLSVVLMILVAGRSNRAGAWLLTPHLGWVSFLGALNWSIVQKN